MILRVFILSSYLSSFPCLYQRLLLSPNGFDWSSNPSPQFLQSDALGITPTYHYGISHVSSSWSNFCHPSYSMSSQFTKTLLGIGFPLLESSCIQMRSSEGISPQRTCYLPSTFHSFGQTLVCSYTIVQSLSYFPEVNLPLRHLYSCIGSELICYICLLYSLLSLLSFHWIDIVCFPAFIYFCIYIIGSYGLFGGAIYSDYVSLVRFYFT